MKPAVRQLLLGNQQWRNTLPALRSFVTANYNQPNPHNQAVMASPPTITASTTQPVGLTNEFRYTSGGAVITHVGGGSKNFFGFRRYPTGKVAPTGENLGDGEQAVAWRAGVVTNATRIGFRLLGTTVPYRFVVDGKYVSTAGTLTTTTSGTNWIELNFGSSASREVWVEGEQASGFDGVAVAPGDSVTAVAATPKRIIFMGDSFTQADGATRKGDGYALVCSDMLGYKDAWLSGAGGTGYVANSAGAKFALDQRLVDSYGNGAWEVLVVEMGINDIGSSAPVITGQVALCLSQLRKRNPSAQIFAVGPWDINAPLAPVANYSATKAAIQAGIPSGVGITFVDPEGVTYTKFDTTHPDTAGHDTLGKWLALRIKNALGA